ncbi:MAG: hypothetical protein HXX08_00600 [Chloroflexi bacterium]|uniref:Uncharacterized protein n=1 Tax=Candidatus Chlorohelix allophototropha TaxID=3003348 RepID=A0A8T7LQP0_9CHLR|nr:hypothetical protein [Chloroflexota bacterium]WJW66247.1 hypothetical protein OZ401_002039 [Chloroflexota bacterium L227-S17]
MDEAQVKQICTMLIEITPDLIEDLYQSMLNEPSIYKRYKPVELHSFSIEGVNSFRDVLISSLQVGLPFLVNSELGWLQKLLAARKIEGDRVHIFLELIRNRLKTNQYEVETANALSQILEEIEAQVKK